MIPMSNFFPPISTISSFKSEYFETDGKACCPYTELGCNYRGLQTEMNVSLSKSVVNG